MPGTIKLYGNNDDVIATVGYSGSKKRREVIDKWAKLYACRFKNCFIQIAPIVGDKINSNGGNLKNNQVSFELLKK